MWYVNPTALLPIATTLNVYPPTLSPRTFKWEVVKFYQSPNLQQLQHFAVLLALHGLCKSAESCHIRTTSKCAGWCSWFMLLCLKLNRMEHAPLLKEINFVKTTYTNLYEIQPVG